MLSSDATSENGKKKSLLPNVSFLDEFSQGGDQKNMSYYLYKGTFGKKNGPKLPYLEEKMSEFTMFIEKKGAMLYSYQGFYGGKDGPKSPYLGERTS
jgi:hypothetical protein